jgi:stearoyl-CoA desaturase (delta-9 desaturase)
VARSWPVVVVHGLAVATPLLAPPSAGRVALAVAAYSVGMVAITAGYHRYFSHRSFRTSRPAQLVLAWAAMSTMQKGVLWWAATHRRHHLRSDRAGDPHTPRDGLWWAHVGWTLDTSSNARDDEAVRDWLAVPELRVLDDLWLLPPLCLAGALALAGGGPAVLWGFLVPVVAAWHASYAVNSVCHRWGARPHATADDSRNNAWVAAVTMGEGWHNNHHAAPSSARHGHAWWQVDATWLVLRGLAAVGLVWDLVPPPDAARDRPRT